MNNKNLKKVLAVAMAATMVLGSGVTVFADDVNSATGTGEATGHLDTDVVVAVLPTSSVDGTFAFTMDPENIIAKAGKIKDGATAVTANGDRVYFNTGTAETPAYGSTSKAVKISAKNYVAADVSVAATVGEVAEGKTIINMAAGTTEYEASTEPTLLLGLKVGEKTGYITSNGITVSDTIDAQDDQFDTVWDATNSKYKLQPKTGESIEWDGLDVQLTGKCKGDTVTDDIVAPVVTLTWTVGKHVDNSAPSVGTTSYTFTKGTALEIPVNLGIGDLAATGVAKIENSSSQTDGFAEFTSAQASYSAGKVTIADSNYGATAVGAKRYVRITFNDTAATKVVVELTIAE